MGSGLGGQGGCEQRIEVFVKIKKKLGGGGGEGLGWGGGFRVDVIDELKFLGKFTKKKIWGGGGQGRCEQRSEVFVKIKKKKQVAQRATMLT